MSTEEQLRQVAQKLAAKTGVDPQKLEEALRDEVAPGKGRSAAGLMVELAEEAGGEFFVSDDGNGYVSVPVGTGIATYRIDPKEDGRGGFCKWLRHEFLKQTGSIPPTNALAEALRTLEGKATLEGECKPIFQRIGNAGGNIYLDLGDSSFRVVEVTPTGWTILDRSPVKFYRARGARALPVPVKGGSIADLRNLVTCKDESDWVLLVSFLLGCFAPEGPYPILILQGPHGSGKSTLSEVIQGLVDPTQGSLLPVSRSEQDLFVIASHNRLLAFDNLSGMPPWLSDALCRISTGGGYGVRAHYSNDDLAIFSVCRPVVINGIDDLAGRYDLQDRSIVIHLERIAEEGAKTNRRIREEIKAAAPGILGSICDALSYALANRDKVTPDRLPRMADFALWIMAAEPALGWQPGTFTQVFEANRREATEVAMDSDPVAMAIHDLIRSHPEWTGTVTDLREKLASDNPGWAADRSCPRSAKACQGPANRIHFSSAKWIHDLSA